MEIVLATRNRSKVEQIGNILGDLDLMILSLDDVGIHGDIEETGNSLWRK